MQEVTSDREPQMVSVVEPYFYHVLLQLVGQCVVVETDQGNQRGVLMDVKPDHIVLNVNDHFVYIRNEKITWFILSR